MNDLNSNVESALPGSHGAGLSTGVLASVVPWRRIAAQRGFHGWREAAMAIY
ncbi:hypothetical protein ISP15_05170 [Dyella jejuensis]|uniref:Uncharacterized protein n=1 Tax=Dyella jejuensis TaxID=1432009 RepID=A0ABW8JIU9_9GAMM